MGPHRGSQDDPATGDKIFIPPQGSMKSEPERVHLTVYPFDFLLGEQKLGSKNYA